YFRLRLRYGPLQTTESHMDVDVDLEDVLGGEFVGKEVGGKGDENGDGREILKSGDVGVEEGGGAEL
ncbi:hypothetical protein HDV00_012235, partial [Rhizophlyctis rosea]